jgi:hypothetical protein
MGGYGSGRRSTRKLTVEECCALDVSLFASPLVWHASGYVWWKNQAGEITRSVGYSSEHRVNGSVAMRLLYTVGDDERQRQIEEPILFSGTKPFFGGTRWWFVCPLAINGKPCERRVRKLYLPLGGAYFGCRACYSLTYESVRTHDDRVGKLVRNPEMLLKALEDKDASRSLLALKAAFTLRGWL